MSDKTKDITFHGTLDVDDIKKYNQYHMRRRIIWIAILSFLLGLLVFPHLADDTFSPVLFSIGLGALLPLVLSYVNRRQLEKNYAEDPVLSQRQYYTADQEGIYLKTDRTNITYLWNDIKTVKEYKDMFLMYITKNKAIVIPKRYFTTAEERTQFQQLVKEKAPVRKKSNKFDEPEMKEHTVKHHPTSDKVIAAGGYLLTIFLPIPLLTILIVSLYWMLFRGHSEFTDHHLTENINFQISFQLYILGLMFIGLIIGMIPDDVIGAFSILTGFGLLAFFIVMFFTWWIVYIVAILATILYKYFKFPLTIRFVRN